MLTYHEQTVRLLGRTPTRSEAALAAIEKAERRCGRRLPESVREWYSLDGIEGALDDPDQDNRTQRLDEFLQGFEQVVTGAAEDVYFFGAYRCNTGFVSSVLLDRQDDPTLLVTSQEPPGRHPFSEFVQSVVWENLTLYSPRAFTWDWKDDVGSYAGECAPPHLDFLTEQFEELPRPERGERWPGDTTWEQYRTFRFFRAGQRIAMTTRGGDPALVHCPAEYNLTADSLDELLDLYEAAWPVHGANVRVHGNRNVEQAVALEAFRTRFPTAVFLDEPS